MPAPYDSRDVAAYIAQQCQAKGIDYNNTKIQKLLYCVYGCYLAWKNERVCREYPRAWKNGPIFPRVIDFFHDHGGIAEYSDVIRKSDDTDLKYVVDELVIPTFAGHSVGALSEWTYRHGSPWDRAVNGDCDNDAGGLNTFIPDGYIYDYFKNRVLANE